MIALKSASLAPAMTAVASAIQAWTQAWSELVVTLLVAGLVVLMATVARWRETGIPATTLSRSVARTNVLLLGALALVVVVRFLVFA